MHDIVDTVMGSIKEHPRELAWLVLSSLVATALGIRRVLREDPDDEDR